MNMHDIAEFLSQVSENGIFSAVQLYFVVKRARYISFNPQLSNNVQERLLDLLIKSINDSTNEQAVVPYNPIGVADGEIELIGHESMSKIDEFFESLSDDKIIKDMREIKVDKIDFYAIKVEYEGNQLVVFRQFQKMKRLRKGFLTRIINNELSVFEGDFFGIDENIDLLFWQDEMLIINHIALERVMCYKDVFLQKTAEAINTIRNENIIVNIDSFAEDCNRDIRIAKRFTEMMSKGKLPLFFRNYDKVPEIVIALNLNINFDEEKKLVYENKGQLFHIVNLLSDSYFKSLLAERYGVVKTEGEI
jgi:hypothetical protein